MTQIKATLLTGGNHIETVSFPCSDDEIMRLTAQNEIGHKATVFINNLIGPKGLKSMEGTYANIHELNYLAKRMDSFDGTEMGKLLAAASRFDTRDLKQLINYTFNLGRITLIQNISDIQTVGVEHYMDIHGGCCSNEEYRDPKRAEEGRALLNSKRGIWTDYGLMFINDEVPWEEVYNGITFPEYLCGGPEESSVAICHGGRTEFVYPPCEQSSIEFALERLGADSLDDCHIQMSCSRFGKPLSEVMDRILNDEGLEAFNEVCHAAAKIPDRDLDKFTAAVLYCMSGDTVNKCIGLWVDSLKWLAEQKTGKYSRFGADTPLEEYLYTEPYDNTALDSFSALEQWLYVCNKYHNYVGMAYYHLADIWRQIERSISDCRDAIPSVESYKAYQKALEKSQNLRAKLCDFLKIDTLNCNVIVEKLLLAAGHYEYEKAIPPLCRAYLYVYDLDGDYGVSSYQDMTEWDVNYGDCEEKPWFDINCMDDDYDTLESEDIVELQEPSPEIREKYVHKALEFFADGQFKSREVKSYMVNVYRIASELMNTDYLKDVLPTLTELADSGDAHFIKLLLRYYEDKNDAEYKKLLVK